MRIKQKFLIIILVFSLIIITPIVQAENREVDPTGFTVVAENQFLKLLLDQSTTEFIVQDKETNHLWYSNPFNLDQEEKIARGRAKKNLHSQIEINYYAPGDQPRVMDNFNDSVQYDQFQITMIENGVRIDYTLGKEWDDEHFIPVMITKDKFEKMILAQIEDPDDRQFVKDQYVLVSLVETSEDEEETEVAAKKLFGNYTLKSFETDEEADDSDADDFFLGFGPQKLDKKGLFKLLVSQVIDHRDDIETLNEIRNEDINQLINNPTYIQRDSITKWDLADLIQIIKKTGYHPNDVQEDHQLNHLDLPQPNQTIFHIPIKYILDDQNLVVSVPVNEIIYPIDVFDDEGEKATYPLHSIEILKYFGAANQKEQGYIFVPDGTGALIDLNSKKTYAKPYEQPLYGIDYAIKPRKEKTNSVEQSYLPVFGLKEKTKAFLAILEKGDAIATVKADIAGRTSSYNTVSAKFTTIPKAKVVLQTMDPDSAEIPNELNIYQARIYNGEIRIRYQFLGQEEANYVGMAKGYQEYLVDQGLTKLNPETEIPFYLEVVGAIDQKAVVMGAPRKVIEPLTSYSQTKEILSELLMREITNIKVRYTGALQGGIKHRFPIKLNLEKSLGGQKELLELQDYLNKQNIEFFPNVSFLNIYQDKLFDGFSANKDAARFLNRKVAKIFDYNIASYQYEPNDFAYLLSPSKLDNLIESFFSDYGKYDINQVSLQEIGRQIYGDYHDDPKSVIDRQEALEIIKKEIEKIDEKYKMEIMVDGGNAFILPYVDHILNAPITGSNFTVIDRTIPFYQIVLHGYVNYAGEPFNFSQDYRKNILQSLETGANPFYLWTFSQSSRLKETNYDHLYSCYYGDWIDDASITYQEINNVLRDLQGQRIIDHQQLTAQVYQTIYEDGTTIIVNYNEEFVMINGIQIAGEDYQVIRKGEMR